MHLFADDGAESSDLQAAMSDESTTYVLEVCSSAAVLAISIHCSLSGTTPRCVIQFNSAVLADCRFADWDTDGVVPSIAAATSQVSPA